VLEGAFDFIALTARLEVQKTDLGRFGEGMVDAGSWGVGGGIWRHRRDLTDDYVRKGRGAGAQFQCCNFKPQRLTLVEHPTGVRLNEATKGPRLNTTSERPGARFRR
jgi:hypothetical protein